MKYELLAPVGSFQALNAAIDAGADAVYLGIKGFNMRAAARNFSIEDLKKVI
jgi:putative protease